MENLENKKQTFLFRGELALLAAVIINSFGVVLIHSYSRQCGDGDVLFRHRPGKR